MGFEGGTVGDHVTNPGTVVVVVNKSSEMPNGHYLCRRVAAPDSYGQAPCALGDAGPTAFGGLKKLFAGIGLGMASNAIYRSSGLHEVLMKTAKPAAQKAFETY